MWSTFSKGLLSYLHWAQANLIDSNRKDPADANCLPILGYLIKKGNTTVFEWRTGVVPKHVEKQQEENYNFGDESSNNAQSEEEDKIDFGDIDVNTLSVDDGVIILS